MQTHKKEDEDMKKLDIAIKPVFIIALLIIYFFWKCEYDLMVTVIAGIVMIGASVLTYFQYKKLGELEDRETL